MQLSLIIKNSDPDTRTGGICLYGLEGIAGNYQNGNYTENRCLPDLPAVIMISVF